MPKKTVAGSADELEDLALTTISEIMSNSLYLPEVRLAAADRALKVLGKAEPAKSSVPQVVFNFGDHMAKAFLGVEKTFQLMKPAQDQATSEADE